MADVVRKITQKLIHPVHIPHDDHAAQVSDATSSNHPHSSTPGGSRTSSRSSVSSPPHTSQGHKDGPTQITSSLQSRGLHQSPHRTENKFKSASHDIMQKLHIGSEGRRSSAEIGHRNTKSAERQTMSKNQYRKHEKRLDVEHRRNEHIKEEETLGRRRREEQERAEHDDTQEMRLKYGTVPVNSYAGEWRPTKKVELVDLEQSKHTGQEVYFRCRVHNIRKMSSKLCFFVFRQQNATIQGVLQESKSISQHMVRWAEHIPVESIVLVRGIVQVPKAKEGAVVGAFIHDMEVLIGELKVVSQLDDHLPFTVAEAEVTEEEANAEGSTKQHVGSRARVQHRVLELRTTTAQAIFRIQSGICALFRGYLDTQGFIEIHTPKLQGGATESGASVFKVNYFGRDAFLAQSPQLAKQMSICADFKRVYEIGAVFRAENSNTHRHLTEYTGLDIEMALEEHYWEARNMIDRTLKAIFKGVYERFSLEIDQIKRNYPHEDLVWLDETPIFTFKDAITMLNDSGWRDEDNKSLPLDEDLGTRDEIQLGRVIKEKFGTDYYIIDKFPASARPFYTMPDPNDPTYTNSFDVFVRGQEIISGGQRVHDPKLLIQQMEKAKVDPKTMEDYLSGFHWGAPPHAGAGIGLERLLMLILQLGDIRNASMYPRDPRSLPAHQVVRELRHPEASTLHPPWEHSSKKVAPQDLQPLEQLIANYGDASNTSWLEPKFTIWRCTETGAAVGYVKHQGFAMTVGDPLCHSSQYAKTIANYLDYVKREADLKPLWVLCGSDAADVLGDELDWRTLSCAAEQRINLGDLAATKEHEIQRKIRHATKEGVKMVDIPIGGLPSREFQEKCNTRIDDWLNNRKDHQHVHLTDVHPWQDMEHRQYHYATDRTGTVHALIVLAQLSDKHGWQVKFSLDFPNAPSGTIEMANVHALKALQASGSKMCTYGGAASNNFIPGHHLKGAKIKMLSKAYHTISTELKLTQKSEFRAKLGAVEDPIWVCYPPRGLGPKGLHAILSFFED